MSSPKKTLGIFGYGSFGALLVEKLAPYFDVCLQTTKDPSALHLPEGVRTESFKAVAECDVIIPAIPLNAYRDWLRSVVPYLRPGTLVVDVCSVKVKPVEMLLKTLPSNVQILATHPVFGPQSAANGLVGQPIVVYPTRVDNYEEILEFLVNTLKLDVVELDPETHDKKMATIHALTFFIGRGLISMDIKSSSIDTGTFKNVLGLKEVINLVELETNHTDELFETIESGNPYAGEVRKNFIKHLQQLDREAREVTF